MAAGAGWIFLRKTCSATGKAGSRRQKMKPMFFKPGQISAAIFVAAAISLCNV
jgi:hypothetical protein